MDIIQQLGPLAIASRLRRLSDRLMKDASRIYQEEKLDFEPRWFPVFYLLSQQPPMALTRIARELRVSHPAINQVANAMEKAGLVVSWRAKSDDRKRLLSLSESGKSLVNKLLPIWNDIKQAAGELIEESGIDLLAAIDRIENGLDNSEMFDRIKTRIKERRLDAVEIVDYKPAYRECFELLNIEWLKKYFTVEPIDQKLLGNPDKQILRKGGHILFARVNGKIVGTVALVRRDKITFELTKMAVTEKAQGQQVGRKLALAAIERARNAGVRRLVLITSPRLTAGWNLYRSLGFIEVSDTQLWTAAYRRKSILLSLDLKTKKP